MKTALQIAKKKISREVGLEDAIAHLLNFGRPHIHCHDDLTWSCSVELNTDQVIDGAKVRSGFKHPTIGSAVAECVEKCNQLGK